MKRPIEVPEAKRRLTTSAMIASIAAEGQRTRAAPFGHALVEAARSRPEIVGMTADLGKYTDLHIFGAAFPERYFQMGMAEQLLQLAPEESVAGIAGDPPELAPIPHEHEGRGVDQALHAGEVGGARAGEIDPAQRGRPALLGPCVDRPDLREPAAAIGAAQALEHDEFQPVRRPESAAAAEQEGEQEPAPPHPRHSPARPASRVTRLISRSTGA